MPRTNRDVLRAGGREAEALRASGIEESQLGEPYQEPGSGVNLLGALSAAYDVEERQPGNGGAKLIAYLERRINRLEFRAADLEAVQ